LSSRTWGRAASLAALPLWVCPFDVHRPATGFGAQDGKHTAEGLAYNLEAEAEYEE
jgi:hypothetical protein